jgi:hypothetical protein
MGPEETAGLDRERERELLGVLRTPGRPRARALPGNFSVGSRPARAALVESQTTRDWTIFFDEESGRVVRMEYVEQTPGGGAPGLVRVDFRDYRDVGGLLWWPHLLQREVGGQPFITLETTAAVANTAPDRSIFAKPAE